MSSIVTLSEAKGRKFRHGSDLQQTGIAVLRYGLVLILLYFGLFKFTPTEARAIQPLLEQSPLMSWLYSLFTINGASRLIGAAELSIAGLILCRPWSARLSALGSLAAVGMFLVTLSFLLSTPGLWQWVDGYPAPSEGAAFLLKDVFLLGAAVVTAGESIASVGQAAHPGVLSQRQASSCHGRHSP